MVTRVERQMSKAWSCSNLARLVVKNLIGPIEYDKLQSPDEPLSKRFLWVFFQDGSDAIRWKRSIHNDYPQLCSYLLVHTCLGMVHTWPQILRLSSKII